MDNRNVWKEIWTLSSTGCALFSVRSGAAGHSDTLDLVEWNPAFECLSGMDRGFSVRSIQGRPGVREPFPDWDGFSLRLLKNRAGGEFDHLFVVSQHRCRVQVITPDSEHLAVFLTSMKRGSSPWKEPVRISELNRPLNGETESDSSLVARWLDLIGEGRQEEIPRSTGDDQIAELSSILDVSMIQSLMDDFYALTGIGVAIMDRQGTLLVATGWQDVCTQFHRVHPITRVHCLESDTMLAQGVAPGYFHLYQCKNHMWDIATPITIGGRHLGNLYLGQFFFQDEVPDQDLFRQQARRYGFDETEYLAALDRVPRFSRETIERVMRFYARFAILVAELGHKNIDLIRTLARQQQTEAALRETLEERIALVSNLNQGVLCEDWNGRILFSNRFFTDLFRLPDPKLIEGKECAGILDQIQPLMGPASRFLQTTRQRLAERRLVLNEELALRDGRILERDYIPVDIEGADRSSFWVYRDITDRKKKEERIRYLSFHDPLTGLYNRTFFEEEITRLSQSRQVSLGVMLCDVNGLKLINDAFGHQAGDRLLISFARILQESCRREDLIARWGGDEFILVLPETSQEAVRDVAERIQLTCRNTPPNPFPISVSLGWSVRTRLSESVEQVIGLAEDRMYRNKLMESRHVRSAIITTLEEALRKTTRETAEHAERVEVISRAIGQAMGLPENRLNELSLLSRLHDLGMITIPRTILNKPEPLTNEEWEMIKRHPEAGYRIVQSSPDLASLAESILCHHERWDGTGYPQGLRGEAIPVLARILAVADAYDVMTSDRPYQKSRTAQEARAELERGSGTQFDSRIVRVFLQESLDQQAVQEVQTGFEGKKGHK